MKLRVVPKTVHQALGLLLIAIIGYFGWIFFQPLGLERGDGSPDGITILQKDSLGKAISDYKIRQKRWPKARSDIEEALAPGVRKMNGACAWAANPRAEFWVPNRSCT